MGPPPPPPPPPLLLSSATLPSGGWKAAQTPRRDNNTIPAPPKQIRPAVDSATLQHAAARLRKTGYHEQIRGDVKNLPDERVAGQDQRLLNGNRPYGAQFNKLEVNQAREQVHATPAYSNNADSVGIVRGCANPRINVQATATASPPTTTYDKTPKSIFQPYKPNTDSYETKYDSTVTRTRSPQPFVKSTAHTQPNYRNVSPPPPYAPSHFENQPYTPNRFETNLFAQRSRSPQLQPAAHYSPSSSYNSYIKETSRQEQHASTPRSVELEWNTPYRPPSSHSPILDPHARIRDYALNHYVEEEPIGGREEYIRAIRKDIHTRTAPSDFATSIRDQSLTASQREANQYQSSTLRTRDLPFDANRLYQRVAQQITNTDLESTFQGASTDISLQKTMVTKSPLLQSYTGDEVDRLVSNMQTEMHVTRTPVPVASKTNICVACNSEITADKPGCTALDKVFHVSCFKCAKCGVKLAGSSFYNIDNNPTCDKCYQDTLEKCTKCSQPISDRLLRACGGTFHVNCFTCSNCAKVLDGVPFTTDAQNSVYCVPCFHEKFAPRCAVCGKGIIPQEGEKESVRVIAMDKSFHPACYKCEDCGLLLSSKVEGAGCYPLDSHLYCKTCNSNRLRMQAPA